MKLSQLKQIIKEEVFKVLKEEEGIAHHEFIMEKNHPTIQKMIERDKPKIKNTFSSKYGPGHTTSELAYDFGGGENPMLGKNVTVVDLDSYGWEDEIEDFKFIEADLTKSQVLSPVNLITANSFISNAIDDSNAKIMASNVDNALKSGGYLFIHDWTAPIEMIMKYLPSYKLIEILWDDDEDNGDVAEVLFRKP
jgi:hypothetical protein